MSSERAHSIAVLPMLFLAGCLSTGDVCSGDFVAENGACDPGCEGIPMGRAVLDATRGCYVGERVVWCVRPAPLVQTDEVHCFVDERTGDRYGSATYPMRRDVPPWIRACVGEETSFVRCE